MRKYVGTQESILKMAKSKKGQQSWKNKSHTEASKIKMSTSAKNRSTNDKNEAKRREGISKNNKGKKHTKESILKLSNSKKGNKNPMFGKTGSNNARSKKVFQFSMERVLIKEWENGLQASKELSLNYKCINNCCRGTQKSTGNFIWSYIKL